MTLVYVLIQSIMLSSYIEHCHQIIAIVNIINSNNISIITITILIIERCDTTGDRCIVSCAGLSNGVYQSCNACKGFITCVGFTPYTIQCPLGLVFDDNKKRCGKTSDTCLCLHSKYQSSPCITYHRRGTILLVVMANRLDSIGFFN